MLLHVTQELPITKSLLDKPVRIEGTVASLSQHALSIYKEMEDSMEKVIIEKTKMIITKFENQMNEPLQRYRSLPKKMLVSDKSLLVAEKKTVNVLTGHTIMPIGKIR